MLIFPILVFISGRSKIINNIVLLKKYFDLNDNLCNIYGAISAVLTVYLIIFINIRTYYLEDFRTVFCKKKVEDKSYKIN